MSEDITNEPQPAPKLDPETLVLRGVPRRVVRFRRQIIIGGGALAALLVGGIAWYSLRHVSSVGASGQGDQSAPVVKATPEAIAGAPSGYGDVPQLGPALPGDLGKPILDHQQALNSGTVAVSTDPAAQTALAERQKEEAERKSARESGLMVQIAGGRRADTQMAPSGYTGAAPANSMETDAPAPAKIALDPARDPGSQQRKADFVAARDTGGDVNPHELVKPASPYTLSAGTVLAASLITGLKSDLPGLVTAQVTENAYDSATGHYLLIPQGSRLIGSYDSVVAYGQKRALVVWQRIILPDGSSVRIDNVPASDLSGYAGLADKVDVHTWQLLKGVVLSTMLGVSTQLSFGSDESDLLRALRQSTQDSVSRAGDQIVSHALNIQPSITVRPGWPLRVVVHKDIILPQPWGMGRRP